MAYEIDAEQLPEDEFLSSGPSPLERDLAMIGVDTHESAEESTSSGSALSGQGPGGGYVSKVLDLKAYVLEAAELRFFRHAMDKKRNPLFALIQAYSKKPKNDPGESLPLHSSHFSPRKKGILVGAMGGSLTAVILNMFINCLPVSPRFPLDRVANMHDSLLGVRQ